jgi:hypothetical protein
MPRKSAVSERFEFLKGQEVVVEVAGEPKPRELRGMFEDVLSAGRGCFFRFSAGQQDLLVQTDRILSISTERTPTP